MLLRSILSEFPGPSLMEKTPHNQFIKHVDIESRRDEPDLGLEILWTKGSQMTPIKQID